jgi:hypothetical protein
MNLKYDIKRLYEKVLIGIAWHLPKNLVYWCAIRVMAHSTTSQYSGQIVPDLTAIDALKRWK